MYRTIIFDLDGTLADTLHSIAHFANAALAHFGYPAIKDETYKLLVGNGADNLVRKMLELAGDTSDEAFFNVSRMYNKTYDDNALYLTNPYPGICELLDSLKQDGCRLGVLSNKPHNTTVKIAESLFGKDFFDICCGKQEGMPKKPDPAALFDILRRLDTSPNEAVFVGDSGVDMQTGHNGGLFPIGVLWGFRGRKELEQNGAGLIVSHPSEIYAFLNR